MNFFRILITKIKGWKLIYASILFLLGVLQCTTVEKPEDAKGTEERKKDQEVADSSVKDKYSLNELNKKIRENPNDPKLYNKRASLYKRKGKLKEAVKDMKRALEIDTTHAPFYLKLGKIYFDMTKMKLAENTLKTCLEFDKKNTGAMIKLAELKLVKRKYDESMEFVNKALKEDHLLAQPYYIKGMIYKETGDTAKSISSFRTAVEQNSNYYKAYMVLGVLHAEKNSELAVEYYDNAIRIDSTNPEPYYNKGMFYQNNDEFAKAVKTYKKLLQHDSGYVDAYYNIGYIKYMYSTKYNEAKENFTQVIKRASNHHKAYYNRGLCYKEMGEFDSAVSDFKKALEIKGDYKPAGREISIIEKKTGKSYGK